MDHLDKMRFITRPRTFDNTLVKSFATHEFGDVEVITESPQPEGMVNGCTGRRRRGKSLAMVTMGFNMSRLYKYPLLTNFKCKYATGLPDAETYGLATGHFTLEEIIDFPDVLHDCIILWDEIDRIFLSKRSTTLVSEFLENGLNLLGKRNIWLFWAAQNIRRINSSLFWQTDFIFNCDSRNKGQSVPVMITDLHGAFAEPGTQVDRILVGTWRHKHAYNTREIFDPLERLSVHITRGKSGNKNE